MRYFAKALPLPSAHPNASERALGMREQCHKASLHYVAHGHERLAIRFSGDASYDTMMGACAASQNGKKKTTFHTPLRYSVSRDYVVAGASAK